VTSLLVARGLLFAFVGFVVVKLAAAQKASRRTIAAHATTLEALATSRERNRLARELHDTLAHSLSAVAVQLEAVKALWHDDPEEAQRMLDRSLVGARDGLGEARRAIQALRASPLEELGLTGALDRLRTETESRSSLEVDLSVDEPLGDLDPHVEQAVFRIADEALTNAVRHASAHRAEIELRRRGTQVELRVSDDGAGFDPDRVGRDGHHGVTGMRERAEMVGGVLTLESAPGAGTTLRFAAEVGP
jgi:signal transduction histidine kinase